MRLPDNLVDRSFTEWNYLVRGIMAAWELARLLGENEAFERQLAGDTDGTFVKHVGRVGNATLQRGHEEQIRHLEVIREVLACSRSTSESR